jgi:hypothetical protein
MSRSNIADEDECLRLSCQIGYEGRRKTRTPRWAMLGLLILRSEI